MKHTLRLAAPLGLVVLGLAASSGPAEGATPCER